MWLRLMWDLNLQHPLQKGRDTRVNRQVSVGDIGPIWLAGFAAQRLSLCLVQSLKASISGAGSKDCRPVEPFRSFTDLPNAAHRSLLPFKNKWTTLMVQMALFPITGLGGFQSSQRNTFSCYLVACVQVFIVGYVSKHTEKLTLARATWEMNHIFPILYSFVVVVLVIRSKIKINLLLLPPINP